jgi:HEAT repeat protein
LGEPARIAIPNLRKVLRPDNNPSQRQAAAKTLGRLGDIASLIEIAKGLEDDALFNGFIEAIKYFGSAADPAVDILSKRLERTREVVRVDKGVDYGVNSVDERYRQIEVIEAFGLIGTTKALDALANSLTNPYLGPFACEEMQKLYRGKGDLNRIIAKIPAEEIQRYKDLSSYVNPCFEE